MFHDLGLCLCLLYMMLLFVLLFLIIHTKINLTRLATLIGSHQLGRNIILVMQVVEVQNYVGSLLSVTRSQRVFYRLLPSTVFGKLRSAT